MKKIRIFLVEDNRVLRDGIVTLLNAQPDMKVVAAIGSGNNVLSTLRKVKPHIKILDLGLWNEKHRIVMDAVKKEFPDLRVIGMGLIAPQTDVVESIEAGASGFIMKDATVKDFLATIRTVNKGIKVLPPSLTGSLFAHVIEHTLKNGKSKITNAVRMTKREREIIAIIADGHSNKEIAQQLNIATHTVKSHVHNIMEKLALHSRLQIATFSHEKEPV